MLESMDLKTFFLEEKQRQSLGKGREIGVSLITTDQTIHATVKKAYQNDERLKYHDDLFREILKKLYSFESLFDLESKTYQKDLEASLEKMLPHGRYNFVAIKYIKVGACCCAIVYIPAYITSFQFHELSRLNEIFEELNLPLDVSITNYNPIFQMEDSALQGIDFDRYNLMPLSCALTYLKHGNRVLEYVLPTKEEPFSKVKVLAS